MRKDIFGITVIGVVLAGIVVYVALRPVPVKAPTSAADTQTPVLLPAGAYTEQSPEYVIAANYPTTTPLASGANGKAIARIQSYIGGVISQFKTGGNAAYPPGGAKQTLQIKYLVSSSPHTVSYIFTVYENTLGAHGNLFFHTFTFDTSTGAKLTLADLFAPNATYLDTLSAISRAELPGVIGKNADTGFITRGTTPEAKNFENFFIDNGYLDILFDPYQVAPYALGPQTLRIPLATLGAILNPHYR